MIPKILKVMIARFPSRNEHPEVADWLRDMERRCAFDPRVELSSWFRADTPITMTRNLAIKVALQHDIDIVIMIDDDMNFDYLRPERTWWEVAFDFMISRWDKAPTIIGAPYCGAPPFEVPMVFRWENIQSDHPNPDYRLEKYSRFEAAKATGVECVAALPTGQIAIDMRIFKGFPLADGRMVKLQPPYFYYEWKNLEQTEKASTEDVVFTRNASLLYAQYGLETCFVTWDNWAAHYKVKAVGKPTFPTGSNIAQLFTNKSEDLTHG